MRGWRGFCRRLGILPFEVAFGFSCMFGGAVGLLGLSPGSMIISREFGHKWALAFNALYFVAGVGIFLGVGLNRRDIEGMALIAVATSISVIMTLLAFNLPMSPGLVNSYVVTSAYVACCVTRTLKLLRGKTLAELDAGKGIWTQRH